MIALSASQVSNLTSVHAFAVLARAPLVGFPASAEVDLLHGAEAQDLFDNGFVEGVMSGRTCFGHAMVCLVAHRRLQGRLALWRLAG